MAGRFESEIRAHVEKYKRRLLATAQASAQELAAEVVKPVGAGGHMRVDTGFLRASLMASTSQMPSINPAARPGSGAAPGSFPEDLGQVNLTIAGASLGETIYLGFTASYAGYREHEDGFVRLAAQLWPEIVERNAARAIRAFR